MIPYLGCDAARTMLGAFVDAELPVDGQVALDAHLRWCETCRARVDDLRLIGAALRVAPASSAIAVAAALAAVQSQVLARIDAERTQSLAVRWREICVDTRFLWPALGATLALVLCVSAIAGVYGAVRAEHPQSLAALVSGRSTLPAPRPLPPLASLVIAPEGEAVFLISAAVAKGGARVATYELLQSAREPAAEVHALVDALRDTRFAPPTTRGDAVVWLVARTTVRGSAEPAARPLSDSARRAP
ncbi:MAG TPA: zf-HC2 domain-containing protein, partial [Thermoanaerobaculia bacterium]|nr:zf-HC2 domain-containing protein [Thermoanaerobaculia bacterium]